MCFRAVAVSLDMLEGEDVDVYELLETGVGIQDFLEVQVLVGGSLLDPDPVLVAGVPYGDDLGYGPAILASPEEVVHVVEGFVGLSEAVLVERFDPAVMLEQLGAGDWDFDDPAAAFAAAGMELIEVYRSAAAEGLGVLAAML